MSLQEQISAALKDAMRARDEVKMATLRLVLTAIKEREKEARSLLEDQEVISVITSQIKQRRESIEQYRKADREDLAQTEESELQILQGYMPEQVSEEEISNTLDEIIAEVGAVSMKDMGKVMKAAMAKLAGKADGQAINAMVKTKLSG
ncbi:MAG: GatB/YqeY domain-containing protein [Syntrophobacteria bacterium]